MQVFAFSPLAARAGAGGATHRVGLRIWRHRGLWEVIGSLEETILLVDDDAALLEVTSIVMASEGYRVLTAEEGVEALRILGRERLDLVVLDIMLPRMSGFEVLKKMREQSDVPVVLLTAKSQSVDKVVGLELGADDYITKPFDTKELQARIKAILRRFGRQEGKDRDGVIRLGPLELDPNGYTVSREGAPLDLTPTEFKILALLMRRPRSEERRVGKE